MSGGGKVLVMVGLVAVALATTAQFLVLGALPETPANDLAMHTAMVEGFYDALASGQWLPRLLSAPGHVPDVPVFQYYGFFTGLVGQPGWLAGLPAFPALLLGVLGFRVLGLAGVYATGRLLGGERRVAFLAAAVYGLTPYLISNLYGRVDVAESLAHCELPFLVLGLVLALKGRPAAGAAVIAGTVACLALTHPIFLLYGAVALAVLTPVAGSGRGWFAATAGGGIGLLLTAFQWHPALLSDDLLSGHFLKYSPFHAAELTSASGLYRLPLTMADRGWTSSEAPFVFHTPGWLTLPMLAALVLFLARRPGPDAARLGRMILVPGALFLFLAYSPVDVFQFLPPQTWALQMPYRLLAFVALFTALALPVAAPGLRPGWVVVVLAVTLGQSLPVVLRPTYVKPLAVPTSTYASIDYLIREKGGLTTPDGWLVYYANPLYPQPRSRDERAGSRGGDAFADAEGRLRRDNRWTVRRALGYPARLRVEGVASAPGAPQRLWLAAADRPEWPLSEVRVLPSGRFSLTLSLPPGTGPFRLVTDPPSGLRLLAVDGIPDRVLHREAEPVPGVLHLKGETLLTDGPTELWLADPDQPTEALTGRISVGPGAFEASLALPDRPGDLVLVPSRFRVPAEADATSNDRRRLSVRLTLARVEAVSPTGIPIPPVVIPAGAVDRALLGGYDRRLTIRRDQWPDAGGRSVRPVAVELPLAFNPFFILTQGGHLLAARPNQAGQAVITTQDLSTPIEARYRVPLLCWLAFGAGVAGLVGLGGLARSATLSSPGLVARR